MTIRPYQNLSLDLIKQKFMEGFKKVLLFLATGAGKTTIFCLMIRSAAEKDMHAIVVVRGRKLVDQASKRLFREQVEHGVLMAKHWNYRPRAKIQVCSIDTVAGKLRPKADLIIIDEAHMATSEGYKEFLADYPDALVVSCTATPWTDKPLLHAAETVVHPITMDELIEQGYLCGFRYFCPTIPDMTDVKVSKTTKDYDEKQSEQVMISSQLTGKIVEHWLKIASGLPTLGFAVNVNHSKLLVQKFIEAGVPAEHVDANCSDKERDEVIKRLESGETKVVFNVGIFCTGVDIPCIGAIINARPTKSKNLFVQQCGRGTRTFAGKSACILLDHAGNIERLGLPTEEDEVDLSGKKKTESTPKETKICKDCFCAYRGTKCPECGAEPPKRETPEIEETNEQLVEINPIVDIYKLKLKGLLSEAKKKKRKPAWAYHTFVNRYGLEEAKKHLPQWFIQKYERDIQMLFARSPYKGVSTQK